MKTPRTVSSITEFGKAALSGANFLALAAILGPGNYGNYVVLAAIAAILVPFASVGYASWVQPLAGKDGQQAAAAAAIPLILLIGLPIVGLVTLAMSLSGFSTPNALFLVLLAEMTLYPTWSTMVYALLANGRASSYLLLSLVVPATKLIATGLTFLIGSNDIIVWAMLVNICGIVGLISSSLLIQSMRLKLGILSIRLWFRRGIGFASVGLASALTDNIDRLIVGRTLGAFSVGVYGMAGRLGGYGAVPVRSIALVAYPRFFALADRHHYAEIKQLMYSIIRRGVLIGFICWLSVIGACYLASITLLQSYSGVVLCTIILSACIPMRAVQYGAGDVLYALNNSSLRLGITFTGAAFSAIGAWVGSAHFGLIGAAAGLVAAQTIVAALLLWGAELSIAKSKSTHRMDSLKNAQ